MSKKSSARLAWSIWVIELLVGGVSIGLSLWNGDTPQPPNSGNVPGLQWLIMIAVITVATVGALLASRQPENAIGWIMGLMAGSMILSGFTENYAIHGLLAAPGSLPFAELMAWLNQASQGVAFIGLWFYILLLFPNGHVRSPRWKIAIGLNTLAIFGNLLSNFRPRPLDEYPAVHNPLGIPGFETAADIAANLSFWLWLILLIASAISLVLRYRTSAGQARQQLKWIAGAALFMSVVLAMGPIIWFTPALSDTLLWPLLFILLQLALPLAIGISILRYRLWDIDVLIRRTLTYAILSAFLALIYFASIVALQRVFSLVTGGEQNEIVTVVSTLTIAALFVPLRNRIQAVIDRRFYRKKYDAQKVLTAFAETVRDETDLNQLSARLMQVVQETMQPKSVSVWLNEQDNAAK